MSEISRLKKELEESRAALKHAELENQSKSELLSTVSHELRTPMGAIISMADLLLTTPLDPTQRKYADTLQQSTRGLLSVLNDILDYAKLDAHAFRLNLEPFDLYSFLESIAVALKAHAATKDILIEVQHGQNMPQHIIADQTRIRQVLNNLVSNAVKFTDVGTITLSIDCTSDANDGGLIRFEVSDTGIGITELERTRLFKRFSQGDGFLTGHRGGTGLGLAIARGLAEKMGGNLDFSSIPGSGSTFWFTARYKDVQEIGSSEPTPDTGIENLPAKAENRILIVDDNKVNQMLISAFLENFGYGFDIADNGGQALDMAIANNYDLILMDIRMPGMDGMETTKRLHRYQRNQAKTPVIALTAHAIDGARNACLVAGMSGFVTKPIDPRSLAAAIMDVLDPGEENTNNPAA